MGAFERDNITFPGGNVGRKAHSVLGLLTESAVGTDILCAPIPLVSVPMHGSRNSLHEATCRLSPRVPGKAYLWLETEKTV